MPDVGKPVGVMAGDCAGGESLQEEITEMPAAARATLRRTCSILRRESGVLLCILSKFLNSDTGVKFILW